MRTSGRASCTQSVPPQCHRVAASNCGESLAGQVVSCAGWAASDDCTSHRRTSDVLGEGHRRGRGVPWGNALKMGRSMEESQPKAAARRIIAPWSDGCTKTPLDGGDRKDLQIVGWDDEPQHRAGSCESAPRRTRRNAIFRRETNDLHRGWCNFRRTVGNGVEAHAIM
jgi:hypothetical protein